MIREFDRLRHTIQASQRIREAAERFGYLNGDCWADAPQLLPYGRQLDAIQICRLIRIPGVPKAQIRLMVRAYLNTAERSL